MRVRTKSNNNLGLTKIKARNKKLEKCLIVCLLPIEEDERFYRRYEIEHARVGGRFDVIKNYLLQLVNNSPFSVIIRDAKELPPWQVHVIEKYSFEKFDWRSKYGVPITSDGKEYVLHFEVPDYLPDECDYEYIPVLEKKAYKLPATLEIKKKNGM